MMIDKGPRMKDIVAKRFNSSLNIDEMLAALKAGAGDVGAWQIRESEYDDRYIRGTTSLGAKVRIIDYADYFEAEIYFDSDGDRKTTSEEREHFMASLLRVLKEAAGAVNLSDA
jgi:hypothetical protein